MATTGNSISNGEFLVSDSRGSNQTQYDSKKMGWSAFSDLAYDSLLSGELGILLQKYLATSEFNSTIAGLEAKLDECTRRLSELKGSNASGKFLPVDGQVILIDRNEIGGADILEYVERYWDLSAGFIPVLIEGCMLRGVGDVGSSSAILNSDQAQV